MVHERGKKCFPWYEDEFGVIYWSFLISWWLFTRSWLLAWRNSNVFSEQRTDRKKWTEHQQHYIAQNSYNNTLELPIDRLVCCQSKTSINHAEECWGTGCWKQVLVYVSLFYSKVTQLSASLLSPDHCFL